MGGSRYSKPTPLTVSKVPPPTEPSVGVREVITIMDSKVRNFGTVAAPKLGTETCTGCIPGGALPAVHVRVVDPSPLSTAITEVHTCPPIATTGVG